MITKYDALDIETLLFLAEEKADRESEGGLTIQRAVKGWRVFLSSEINWSEKDFHKSLESALIELLIDYMMDGDN